jgi:hypothetical protein
VLSGKAVAAKQSRHRVIRPPADTRRKRSPSQQIPPLLSPTGRVPTKWVAGRG